ncbi:phospholipase D/transphosphatidylase [Caballeronia concitans]|uniref:Cardiolipin synthase B n=1 Tax=Caballeronia concitans TaxID=1777133 RepID=A0A658QRD9_9BURK|nr:phospholipase D-like domain-containing protein [Caballeronia concitans]KIG02233.1 Phospholipase D-like domain containing protein [Burkholderia sp. MR1]SAL13605.1 phospholipase D/transphosphatidylase [Caballeronia concitans]
MIGVRPRRNFKRLRQALFSGRRPPRLCFTVGNHVRIFQSGVEFFPALIERIDNAKTSVSLETYIFANDDIGRAVSDALVRAAARGVVVRVITDGVGTQSNLPMFAQWKEGGVEHRVYNPHLLFGPLGFSRTHRKLALIDNVHAFCGGINIVDDFDQNGTRLDVPRWDFAMEAQGPVVKDVRDAFDLQWQRIRLGVKPREPRSPNCDPEPPQSRWSSRRALRARQRARLGEIHAVDRPCVAFVARDNLLNRRAIEKAYLRAIAHAEREVLLANPYFMPGRKLRRALVHAAQRGVRVSLVIGRKEFVALDYATPFLYGNLLKHGVRIAEYEKTMLHGKVAVVDADWATIGSSNLDALSLVLNNEANMVLVNHPEIAGLHDAILQAFDEASPIDEKRYASRPLFERVLSWLAYNTYRAMMKMITIGQYD